jgi:DNA-binding NarL/FixJ family response regulator
MSEPAAPGKTIRLLVVDDNDRAARSLARCCQVPGLTVVGVAPSRSTALAALAADIETRPDVVLIDYRLEAGNGLKVATEMLAAAPGLKVLLVTANASDDVRAAARRAGLSGCIEKTMSLAHALPGLVRRAYAGEVI